MQGTLADLSETSSMYMTWQWQTLFSRFELHVRHSNEDRAHNMDREDAGGARPRGAVSAYATFDGSQSTAVGKLKEPPSLPRD